MTYAAVVSVLTDWDGTADLAPTLTALQAQQDSRWQWCLAAPDAGAVGRALDQVAAEPRVLVLDAAGSGLEAAFAAATGRVIAALDAGDELDPNWVAILRGLPERRWAYSDEARRTADGIGLRKWLKPGPLPELARSQPYQVSSAVLPREVALEAGGFDAQAGTAQWYDLVLRVAERIGEPLHLYGPHLIRRAPATTEQDTDPPWLQGTTADRVAAIRRSCERTGLLVSAVDPVIVRGRELGVHLERALTRTPTVSVIIPTAGGSSVVHGFPRLHVMEAVASLWTADRYPELELVVSYDEHTPRAVLDGLVEMTGGEVVLHPFHGPFDFAAKCNQAALAASGEYLCFLNDDVRVRSPRWLHAMAAHLQDPGVGAVGARLLFADGTLQHAGIALENDIVGHLFFGDAADTVADAGLAQLAGERSGVTGACLLVRAADFGDVGGFSPEFPLNYNDVDLCLKLRTQGLRVIYEPAAELDHYESQTRQGGEEPHASLMIRRRWLMHLFQDLTSNPLRRRSPVQVPPDLPG